MIQPPSLGTVQRDATGPGPGGPITLQNTRPAQDTENDRAQRAISAIGASIGQYVDHEHRESVEADVLKQKSRALNGAMASDDATEQGRTAHGLILARNDVQRFQLEMNTAAAERYNQGADGDWEGWGDALAAAQSAVLEKYADSDQDIRSFVIDGIAEVLPGIQATRYASGQEHIMQDRAEEALTTVELMSQTGSINIEAWRSEAGEMGLSEEDQDAILSDFVIQAAGRGEVESVEAFEKETFFQRSPKMLSILNQARDKQDEIDQVSLGIAVHELVEQYKDGHISEPELITHMRSLNDRYDNRAFTDKDVTRILDGARGEALDRSEYRNYVKTYRAAANKPGVAGVGFMDIKPAKHRQYLLQYRDELAQDFIENQGSDPEQALRNADAQLVKEASRNVQVVPHVKDKITAAVDYPFDNLDMSKPLPDPLVEAFHLYQEVSPAMRDQYLTDPKDRVFMDNYWHRIHLRDSQAQAAFVAQNARTTPITPTTEFKTKLWKQTESQLKSFTSLGWFSNLDKGSGEFNRALAEIRQMSYQDSIGSLEAPDVIAKRAAAMWREKVSPYNGGFVNAPEHWLNQQLGSRDYEKTLPKLEKVVAEQFKLPGEDVTGMRMVVNRDNNSFRFTMPDGLTPITNEISFIDARAALEEFRIQEAIDRRELKLQREANAKSAQETLAANQRRAEIEAAERRSKASTITPGSRGRRFVQGREDPQVGP